MLKSHIKTFIESLNEYTTDYTIYISNVITELETKFIDYIKSIDLVSVNGKDDSFRILFYDMPDELKNDHLSALTETGLRRYIPEYINVPLENIDISISRSKY